METLLVLPELENFKLLKFSNLWALRANDMQIQNFLN